MFCERVPPAEAGGYMERCASLKAVMKFSELLAEAIVSAQSGLDDKQIESLRTEITALMRAWVEIHEPEDAGIDPQDPQRLLLLQLLEELEDGSEIPIVE